MACAALLAGTPAPPSGHTQHSQAGAQCRLPLLRIKTNLSCCCLWIHLSSLSFPRLTPHILPSVTQTYPVFFSLPPPPHATSPAPAQRVGLEAQARKCGASSLTTEPQGLPWLPARSTRTAKAHSSHGPVALPPCPSDAMLCPCFSCPRVPEVGGLWPSH